MKFTKMHGIGNDYVYVNCFEEEVNKKSEFARMVSDRHKGIGSDGAIFICPHDTADCEMQMYNADGSKGEMCGNGMRCVAKYVYDNCIVDKKHFHIASGGRIYEVWVDTSDEEVNEYTGVGFAKRPDGKAVRRVKIDMGEPILLPERIPVIFPKAGDLCVNQDIYVENANYRVTCVSMGNPHAIVFMDHISKLPIEEIGPGFENHPFFPNRINTEFVRVANRKEVYMRVWERGSGETMACGTGACAVAVASILNGYTDETVTVHLLGGDLSITWNRNGNNHVLMTGEAVTVFEGEI